MLKIKKGTTLLNTSVIEIITSYCRLFLGKPDCPAGLKSNLEEIKTVYAVCTVKNVDSLDPTQLLLRLEATSRDNPDDTFTVNFTADTDDLQPLPEDITRDLDGYLKWDIKGEVPNRSEFNVMQE